MLKILKLLLNWMKETTINRKILIFGLHIVKLGKKSANYYNEHLTPVRVT